MNRRALVTGGTGMLGSHIVDRLRSDGWTVRALVRCRPRAAWLEARGAELAEGQLEEPASLTRAVAGCDVVFHAAAVIGSGGDWSAFRVGNVEGTASVVRAAELAGARVVYVSSTAVYGRARYGEAPTHEGVALPTLPRRDVYGRSKQDAERVVLRAHAEGRIWATIVRPPVMYGRGDRQFAPRVGAVLARGFFPRIGGGRTTLALVHAGSVADGSVRAATYDRAGGRVFLLANDVPVTVTDLVRAAEEGLGRRIWAPEVPRAAGRAGFSALRCLLRVCGRGDLACHAGGTFDMLTRDNPFTSDRARSELGWAPAFRADEKLAEAFRWWRGRTGPRPDSGRRDR